MKTALILHGTCDREEYFDDKYPSLSNSHWFPWLQKQLLIKGFSTQTLEMPEAYDPQYNLWKKEFERFEINEETTLIGHSCGGGFLVRWLSENRIKVNKLVLVAPWMDPNRIRTSDFFNFKIDKDIILRTKELHLLVSNDEVTDGVKESVDEILKNIPNIRVHKFNNYGHFTFDEMRTEKFPELLEIILK